VDIFFKHRYSILLQVELLRTVILLSLGFALVACSTSDWEEQQFSDQSPVNYVAKNDEGDGFVIREGMLVASSEKLLSILDSGSSYPFELYMSDEEKVLKYFGRTDVWNKHRGILLLPDLALFFSTHPELLESYEHSEKMTLVLLDKLTELELYRYTTNVKGLQPIINREGWKK
jgi:hypothetical protein